MLLLKSKMLRCAMYRLERAFHLRGTSTRHPDEGLDDEVAAEITAVPSTDPLRIIEIALLLSDSY